MVRVLVLAAGALVRLGSVAVRCMMGTVEPVTRRLRHLLVSALVIRLAISGATLTTLPILVAIELPAKFTLSLMIHKMLRPILVIEN